MIDGIGYICVFWSGDCWSEIFIRLGGFGGESEEGFDIDFNLLKQIVLTLNNRGIRSIYWRYTDIHKHAIVVCLWIVRYGCHGKSEKVQKTDLFTY